MIPLPPHHIYNFERRLKKVIGTKKKSYLIFCVEIIELSTTKILTLNIHGRP